MVESSIESSFFVLLVFLCWNYNHNGVMCQDGCRSVNALVFKICYFVTMCTCVYALGEVDMCRDPLKARGVRSSRLASCGRHDVGAGKGPAVLGKRSESAKCLE